jgi:hypothetical protein
MTWTTEGHGSAALIGVPVQGIKRLPLCACGGMVTHNTVEQLLVALSAYFEERGI